MTQQFTANEVRDLSKRGTDAMQQFIDGRHTLHIPPQSDDADMVIAECLRAMGAFADLLEAQEKAVPVYQEESSVGWHDITEAEFLRLNTEYKIPPNNRILYTHPAPAQLPAASVTDWTDAQCVAFMAVGLRHTEYKKGKSPTVEEIRQGAMAALAAQENPNG